MNFCKEDKFTFLVADLLEAIRQKNEDEEMNI